MQLDLILRGQSNAAYFAELDGGAAAQALTRGVEELLGFDGVTNSVRLVYDRDEQGADTAYPATYFLGEWMSRSGPGWVAGPIETRFLERLGQYRAEGMGDASAVVWLHSEYDSMNPLLQAGDWANAVRSDAALVRGTLGREVPYLFVAAHPYSSGTGAGHQAIRAGMELLSADPAFDGRIAARAPDIDASLDDLDGNPATTEYGYAHITAFDAQVIAARIARGAAEEWARFALPGSPVAQNGGNIASQGPEVISAKWVDGVTLLVDVRHDAAFGFVDLNEVASRGVGWSLAMPDGRRIEATGAAVLDGDSLVVRFGEVVPWGAVLDYAWGIGRVADPDASGIGNAVMDPTYLPVWTPAGGILVVGEATLGGAAPALPAAPAPVVAAAGAGAFDPEMVLAAGLVRIGFGRAGTEGEVRSLYEMLELDYGLWNVADALVDGPWFQDRVAGLGDTAFIQQLYGDALGRAARPDEVATWLAEFASGTPREVLAPVLAESAEFAAVAQARAASDLAWL
ncbi:DUF4214 domain-containing protein [Falsiroseomonas sp. CW058]|uniref:DUF4214 domain-containing protein n=1 Tax=Falsiroseomonas sp. CW058 TaxID=3388664 RepID=UPI003D3132B2